MSSAATFTLAVDASKGRQELANFQRSVDGVTNSLGKLASSSGGFADLGRQIAAASSGFDRLKSVAGLKDASREINALSKSLGGLTVNSRATSGLLQLSRALSQLSRTNLPRGLGSNLDALGRGLANLHVPDSASINRLPAIMSSIARASNVQINARTGAEIRYLGDGLRSLATVPVGPLQRVLNTLERANVDKIRALSTALHGMTLPTAVNARNLTPTRVPSQAPSVPQAAFRSPSSASDVNAGSFNNASAGLRDLERSFSAVHAAAAAFAGYLGGLSLSSFTHSVLEAGNALTSFKISTDTLASSGTETSDALKFVEALADRSGSRLDTLISGYQRLGGAMRSLGMPVKDVQTTFEGFTSALQAQHIAASEQSIVMRELAEVASMGSAHARQIQSISMHVPDFRATLMQVTRKKEGDFKKQLEDGGFSVEDIVKTADVLKTRYTRALAEARTHSQAQLNLMSNDWTKFKQTVFEGGFDAGLAAMVGSIRDKLDEGKVSDLAKGLGDAFKSAFAEIGALGAVAANHVEGFTRLGLAIAGVTAASLGLTAIGFIAAPLTAAATAAGRLGVALLGLSVPFSIPILAGVAALAVLVETSGSADEAFRRLSGAWADLKNGFTDWVTSLAPTVSATFSQMESDGRALTDVLMNIGSYAKAAIVWGRTGETRSVGDIAAAYKADAAAKLAAAGKPIAQADIAPPKTEAFEEKVSGLAKRLTGLFGSMGGGFLKEFQAEQAKTAEVMAKSSTALQHHGDYATNAATAAERLRHETEDLRNEQNKLYEKLNSSNSALAEYRKTIASISAMAGRKDSEGHIVGADRIAAMTRQAQLEALPKVNPAADEIRKLTDQVELKSKFAGDKDALDAETKVLELRNKMLAAGVELTGKQEAAYRALLTASKDLDKGGSNGFTQWANSVKSETESMNDNIKTTMGSLSDGLSKLVTEGRGKFKSLGEAIRSTFAGILSGMAQRFIKAGIDNLMASAVKQFAGNDQSGFVSAIFGGKKVVSDALSGMADKAVASMNVTAANVVINGGIGGIGTSGVNAFGTNGTAGGSAMGSVDPQKIASATNPPLANVASGGTSFLTQTPASLLKGTGISIDPFGFAKADQAPMSIDRGSATAFGGGLSSSSPTGGVTMALGRYGQPLGTIGRDGFAGFTPLSSIAPRTSGVGTLGSGSSIAALSGQSPSSFLSARTAEDNMQRAGLGHLDFSKGGLAGREAYAWNFFKQKGYSDANTAKILGNLKQEGGFNPRALNPNDGGRGVDSVGIAQWNNGRGNDLVGGRRALMERHAEGLYGKPYNQLNDSERYHAQLSNVARELKTPYYSRALSRPDAASFGKLYEGYGDNSGMTRNGYANDYLRRFGGRSPGIDPNSTGSIAEQMKPQMQKIGTDLAKNVETATKAVTPQISQDFSKAFGSSGGANGQLTQFASKVSETGSAAQSAEGGLGGLIGKLGQLGGGGGGGFGGLFGGGGGDMLAGMFREGGYVGDAVDSASLPASLWHGAPAFAEGGVTPNAPGGAIPSLLHPGEVVIPLSRGRAVPVELRGDDLGGGNTVVHNHMNMNLQTRDQDSFRRNSSQVMTQLQNMLGRAAARNG